MHEHKGIVKYSVLEGKDLALAAIHSRFFSVVDNNRLSNIELKQALLNALESECPNSTIIIETIKVKKVLMRNSPVVELSIHECPTGLIFGDD